MQRKQGKRPKQKTNPLLKVMSTDAERITHKPEPYIIGKKIVFPDAMEWLMHLESDVNPNGKPKATTVRTRDLATLQRFWRVAEKRARLKQLFATDKTEAQIAREVGVSREMIRVLKLFLMPERLTAEEQREKKREAAERKRDYLKPNEFLRARVSSKINPRQKLFTSIDEIINAQIRAVDIYSRNRVRRKKAIQRALKYAMLRRDAMRLFKTDLSEAEIVRRLGVSTGDVNKLKKILMPKRPTWWSRARERREQAKAGTGARGLEETRVVEELKKKKSQTVKGQKTRKKTGSSPKKTGASAGTKTRTQEPTEAVPTRVRSHRVLLKTHLKKYGVGFKALQEIYDAWQVPENERSGVLFARMSAKVNSVEIRKIYHQLSANGFSFNALWLMEMDRLWLLNPERMKRSPEGVKRIAKQNLERFGIK